jgi:enolase
MYYSDVQTYLNEEFRKPIKYYLKDTPKKTQEKVMQVVDCLCDKYRQVGGTSKYFEELMGEIDFETFDAWTDYMEEKGYLKPIDYDALRPIYSDEEVEDMLSEE